MDLAPDTEWVELADGGSLRACAASACWLGGRPDLLSTIVLDGQGQRVVADRHPAARARRGEPLDAEPQCWIVRATGAAAGVPGLGRRTARPPGAAGAAAAGGARRRVAASLLDADDPSGRAGEVLGRMAFALGAEALALLSAGERGLAVRAAWGAWPRERLRPDASWLQRAAAGREAETCGAPLPSLGEPWALALCQRELSWACAVPFSADGEPRLVVLALRDPSGLDEDERASLESAVATWRAVLRRGRRQAVEARAGSGIKAWARPRSSAGATRCAGCCGCSSRRPAS
jgi:hypothetical protein